MLRKRIVPLLGLLLLLLVLLPASPASAATVDSGACGDKLTWTLDDSGKLTISGTGAMANSPTWNNNKDKIKSVVIGSGVTSIGNYAFRSCTKMTSVTIGSGVVTIGEYAFENCDELQSVKIPDSVTSIGFKAFNACDYLASVTIGNGVVTIGNDCFRDCDRLSVLSIGSKVKTIGNYAFCDCDALTSVTIPDSVESIGSDAFDSCDKLQTVKIGSGVKTIGNYAFRTCVSLTNLTIGSSVQTIGEYAFENCDSLTSVLLPDSVTEIRYKAFNACDALVTVTIGNGVKTIGNDSFRDCVSLKSVTFGNRVKTIGNYAFTGCSSLTSVLLPDSVESVGNDAFSSCSKLTKATVGNGATSIGNYAFRYCAGMKEVSIGHDVKTIGEYAFEGCSSLKDVYYSGEAAQWNKITVKNKNEPLLSAARHYLLAPTGITTGNNQTTGRVTLSWKAAQYAAGYNIYRCDEEIGIYTKLNDAPVAALTYTDGKSGNAGNTYWYKVLAWREGLESPESITVSRVAMCQRPTGLKATPNDQAGTVKLTWTAPTIKSSVSGYRIYKWNSATNAFEWIGGSLKAGGSATSITIPSKYITRGEKAQYSIRGYNSKNTLESISIYAVPATATVKILPATPTGLTAANNLTTGRVKLSWKSVSAATGYNIYRATSENGTYTKLNESPVTALTYTDGKSGNAGLTYWYKVTAVNGSLESAQSAAVSRVSMCQRPASLKAVANADGSVKLTWAAPAIAGSVSGYRVYLWDKSANGGQGAFQWISGSLKAAGSATSVTVPASALTACKGQSVQFSIRGFNNRNVLSSMSIYAAPASATVK